MEVGLGSGASRGGENRIEGSVSEKSIFQRQNTSKRRTIKSELCPAVLAVVGSCRRKVVLLLPYGGIERNCLGLVVGKKN